MVNEKMLELGTKSSVIRELFEYGKKRKKEIGAENVFDFSLGNPSIPAPEAVRDAYYKLLFERDAVAVHGYTSAQGDMGVREKIAESVKKRFDFDAEASLIYMTCGAAASLMATLKALVCQGDEVIALAPFFPEYRVFCESAGAAFKVVKCREADFQIDLQALEEAITENTKAVIVNSPNNPTGAVFSKETVVKLAELLREKQREYGSNIFIIADEPYRELVYGDVEVPYIPKYYDNTVVCYSYSKSLSLPGDRIGYILVSPKANEARKVFAAVCGAGRALGYVCAPAMAQYVIGDCLDESSDIAAYDKNRTLLYNSLCEMGYEAIRPDGAFYLFVKSPEADASAF
ncbi:MAG: pyridoxal phosphate-dependent aminotransferase, partial [Clostridia bacterium]|nr:pyridoxal phosphate-dependent aminotransferase [Clostridia bacterium]